MQLPPREEKDLSLHIEDLHLRFTYDARTKDRHGYLYLDGASYAAPLLDEQDDEIDQSQRTKIIVKTSILASREEGLLRQTQRTDLSERTLVAVNVMMLGRFKGIIREGYENLQGHILFWRLLTNCSDRRRERAEEGSIDQLFYDLLHQNVQLAQTYAERADQVYQRIVRKLGLPIFDIDQKYIELSN